MPKPLHAVTPAFRQQKEPYRWPEVEPLIYKEHDTTFRSVTRRVLFDDDCEQNNQVRYFEVAPGGWTTFEHHWHTHEVIVFRGSGTALVGSETRHVEQGDLVFVDHDEWHQFSATDGRPLGIICIVTVPRDRPVRPTAQDLEAIYASHPELKDVIRV